MLATAARIACVALVAAQLSGGVGRAGSSSQTRVRTPESADGPGVRRVAAPRASAPSARIAGAPSEGRREFFVTPEGAPTGDGSRKHPWDLQTALAQPASVAPGSTIWLRGGTYVGAFESSLVGTADAPIVMRAWPGERVVVDENVGPSRQHRWNVRGSYTWYWGIEVTDSDPVRSTEMAGSDPRDVPRESATVYALGDHLKFVNMVLHDLANGLSVWEPSIDTEIYGCLTFDNGWNGPDRGHGHGIYTQNDSGTKLVEEVISFNNFETGMKAFGVDGSSSGYRFSGVVSFNNGSPAAILRGVPVYRGVNLLVGSQHAPSERISISDSHFYYPAGVDSANIHLGYLYPECRDVSVTGSTFVRGQNLLYARDWESVVATGNTFWLDAGAKAGPKLVSVDLPADASTGQYTIDANTYYDTSPDGATARPFLLTTDASAQNLTFAAWRARTGFDAESTYVRARPTGTRVVVRPNAYEPGRANVVVYNWSGAQSVVADLSGVGLARGRRFEIRDVQNLFGEPVYAGAYDGPRVRIPLTRRKVTAPTGLTTSPEHTGPEFFVFLVVPLGPA